MTEDEKFRKAYDASKNSIAERKKDEKRVHDLQKIRIRKEENLILLIESYVRNEIFSKMPENFICSLKKKIGKKSWDSKKDDVLIFEIRRFEGASFFRRLLGSADVSYFARIDVSHISTKGITFYNRTDQNYELDFISKERSKSFFNIDYDNPSVFFDFLDNQILRWIKTGYAASDGFY